MRPYLRVANVFEDRIDATDLMEMHFPSDVFEKFRLREGDILLNEGQSPEYLGRPAIYRGEPKDVAFTNSLLRFRCGPDAIPEWALLVFRRHMHARRFIREVRITTNIAHLSAGRLKSIEFPIPPIAEQERIVAKTRERLEGISRLSRTLSNALAEAKRLRASLLDKAISGHLLSHDPTDESASALLDRLAEERVASGLQSARKNLLKARRGGPQKETLL
jgi:type I restriction enzyme S subunit